MEVHMKKTAKVVATLGVVIGMTMVVYAAYSGYTTKVSGKVSLVKGENSQAGAAYIEEVYEEADGKYLQPGATVSQSVKLVSNVEYSAIPYIRVQIPTVTSNGNVIDAVNISNKTDWSLVDSKVSSIAGTKSSYIYQYNEVLDAGETTSELYDSFSVSEYNELGSNTSTSIDVDGVLLQSTGYEAEKSKKEALLLFSAMPESNGDSSGNSSSNIVCCADHYTISEIDEMIANLESGVYTKEEIDQLIKASLSGNFEYGEQLAYIEEKVDNLTASDIAATNSLGGQRG
jgi:hypothetical protein